MKEFWDKTFIKNKEMWGFEPAPSTMLTKDLFVNHQIKNVLIPGIGYGRNARIFMDHGMTVTGIEISQTAIDLAYKYFGDALKIHHGSVSEMPFDDRQYDGIYCYALIHLLEKSEREKLIQDCYNQLSDDGYMVFTTVTKEAEIYGHGTRIDKDRFQVFGGLKLFFYDRETIQEEFGKAELYEIIEVNDVYPFYLIKCKKKKRGKT